VIGVTGSVGKTGTKEALRLALSKDGETHASVASYNNQWGVPLSLARCPLSTQYAVLEMGMNHPGEIAPLARLVRPHVAVVTTIAPVHLEFLGSLVNIAEAKAEIFLGVPPDGAAVINRDISQFALLEQRARHAGIERVISFGEHAQADARLIKCALHARCSTVEAEILGTRFSYKIAAPGRHLVINSLAVLAAAELVGADIALAALALAELQAAPRRSRSSCPAVRRYSSMRATTPIRPRSKQPWRCSVDQQSVRMAGASPCLATCWNLAWRVRICIAS
jgi:UDP-N-acetylmuramoyl-tripeptide--D-alanyl-D-alanine ligase